MKKTKFPSSFCHLLWVVESPEAEEVHRACAQKKEKKKTKSTAFALAATTTILQLPFVFPLLAEFSHGLICYGRKKRNKSNARPFARGVSNSGAPAVDAYSEFNRKAQRFPSVSFLRGRTLSSTKASSRTNPLALHPTEHEKKKKLSAKIRRGGTVA